MSATNDANRDSYRQTAGHSGTGSEASMGHGDTFHRRKTGAPLIVTPIRRSPLGTAGSRRRRRSE